MMRKTVRKYMPYSPLEFDKIECWLEEMAAEGLELIEMTGRFVKFKRTEPRKVRYRIGRSDCGRRTKMETEYIEGCKELGWDFVTILGSDYYVFRTENEDAVEFYTDGFAFMQDLDRRIRGDILGALALIAVFSLKMFNTLHSIGSGGLFAHMVENGFVIFPYGIIVFLLIMALWVWRIVSLTNVRKRLISTESQGYQNRSCRDRKIRSYAFLLVLLVTVAWLGDSANTYYKLTHSTSYSLQAYDYSYRFPLLDELNPGDGGAVWANSGSGSVMFERTELAPVIVMTCHYGEKIEADTERKDIYRAYTVNYYELQTEKLAKKYFDKKAAVFGDGGAEALVCGGLDAVWYDVSADGYEQDLLILKNHVVIKVWYVGDSNLPDYLPLFAADLEEEDE